MNVTDKSIGMLVDEFIVNLIQYRAPDETFCASDNNDALLDTILSEVSGDQLKMVLVDIIKLAIEHAMIYFNRRFLLYSTTDSEALAAARRVNEINANRVGLVRAIDNIADTNHLTFSPKTYGQDRITRTKTTGLIVDDFISSLIKSYVNDSDELKERVELLAAEINKRAAQHPATTDRLVELAVAATMCFFIQDIMSHSTVDSEAIQAGRDILVANKLRKNGIKQINQLLGE